VEIKVIKENDTEFFLAGDVADLQVMASKAFCVDIGSSQHEGFFVRVENGDLFAYKNSCPHTGAPLNWTPDQFLTSSGRYIQCSIHGAMFKSETGECFSGPCSGKFLQMMKVIEREGQAFVEIERL
jgi:nitrite reductase/ring-hydroxylating ferredoxin subunit